MREFGNLNILKPQLFTENEEISAIRNTMTIDYWFGHEGIVAAFASKFASCKPWAKEHVRFLKSLGKKELKEEVEKAKPKSLLMTPIMLTGECNANCEICYTDRKKKQGELQWSEIKEIIDQTKNLGSRTIYIAGEGEPTLDSSIFKIFDYAKKISMDVIIFTNGILLSNEKLCKARLGIDCETLVDKIAETPVYVYHKLWSCVPEKNRQLMGLCDKNDYEYSDLELENGEKIKIPHGLELLLKKLPRERLGIEACVEKRNADEINETIIPFVKQTKIKSYIEPLIHSGKNFGNHRHDPSPAQITQLSRYLVRQGCTRIAYMFAVHNNGYATPGISILPEHLKLCENCDELNIRNPDDTIKDIFTLRHTHKFLVENRYKINGCLCESFNLEMARKLKGN